MRYLKFNEEIQSRDQLFDGAKWGTASAFIGEFVSKRSGKLRLFRRPPKKRSHGDEESK